MTVFSYVRVSTLLQATDGESLGQQERECRGYAMMKGFDEPVAIIERGVSGSVPLADRPEGSVLLNSLKRGDIVICAKLDRIFRSARDALNMLEDLQDMGVALHLIDLGGDVVSNGISKLVFTILSAVAEQERHRTRERIAAVKADQKARGRFLGGKVPFGWRIVDGGIVEDVFQQDAIRQIKALKADGLPLRAISETMTKRGFPVSHCTVNRIVKSA